MPDLTVTMPNTELGSSLPVEKQVDLTSSDSKRVDVTLTSDQAWLTPNPATGQMASSGLSVNLEADISGLTVGSHSATVTVAATNNTCATNSPYEIQADLTVTQPPAPDTALTQPMIGVTTYIELVYGYTSGGEAVTAPANLTYPIANLGNGTLSGLSASTSSGNVGASIVGGNLQLDMSSFLPENISGWEQGTITINDAGASNNGLVIDLKIAGLQQGTDQTNGDDWHSLDPAQSIQSVRANQGANPADITVRVLEATTFNNHGNAAGSGATHPLSTYGVNARAVDAAAPARIASQADAGGGNITINHDGSAALANLANGDTVIIRNTGENGGAGDYDGTYTVANVVANTSFDISASWAGFSIPNTGSVDRVTPTNWIAAAPSTAGEDTDLTVSFTTSSLSAGVYRALIDLDFVTTDYVLNPITHTVFVEVV